MDALFQMRDAWHAILLCGALVNADLGGRVPERSDGEGWPALQILVTTYTSRPTYHLPILTYRKPEAALGRCSLGAVPDNPHLCIYCIC